MWIKKLYATFGKLDEKTLELHNGLNIISGENESGKSTWSAFIRVMLYGISTKEQSKAGFVADKERFRPWSGKPMYGRAEISKGGEDITIERISGKNGVFSKESASYDRTSETVETGEALVGVSKNVFERTAFIGQAKLELSADADIERRILSMASSGDEEVSAGEVITRLEKKQREIRSPRGLGLLPSLCEEEEKLSALLEEERQRKQEDKRVSESLEAYKKEEEKLSRKILIAEAEEKKKQRRYIEKAESELSSLLVKAKEAETLPDNEKLLEFEEKKQAALSSELESKRMAVDAEEKRLSACRFSDLAQEKKAFSGLSEQRAREMAEEDILSAETNAPEKISPILLLMPLLAVALAIFAFIIHSALAICAAALLVVWLVFFITAIIKSSAKKTVCKKLYEKYGTSTPLEIKNELEEYISLLSSKQEAEKNANAAEIAAESMCREAELRKDDVFAHLKRCGLPGEDMAEEKTLRELCEKRRSIMQRYSEAKIRVEAIANSVEETELFEDYDDSEIPEQSCDFLLSERESIRLRIKNSEISLATLAASAKDVDEAKVSGRLSEVREEKDALSMRLRAIERAMQKIRESENELKRRFSPELEKRASEIFEFLTGGHFKSVRIEDKNFEMNVSETSAAEPRSRLLLSRGTLDELYLALRLSLCESIIDGEDAPPIVLDDALVNFDDVRAHRALELLFEIAKKRQVLLFTCHSREERLCESLGDANIIKI